MFKRILCLVVAFCTLTAQASQVPMSTDKPLLDAYNEMTYALTVEWDQENQDFYSETMEKFKGEVAKLQAQGLTNEQLINFTKSRIKDKNVAKDFDQLFSVVKANKMSQTEARKFVQENLSKQYSKGASWMGYYDDWILWTLLIVVVVVLVVAADGGGGSSHHYTETCVEEYVCDDYYDAWGNYMYSDCYYDSYCY